MIVAVAAAVMAVAVVAPAAHADPAPTAGGWVRLAHLSPDTPAVNVTLTGLGGSRQWVRLHNVGYGDVSGYQRVPAGVYVAAMTPAGGTADSQPVISQAVTVQAGHAYTVAAMGRHAHLTGRVLADDLTPPATGKAKVRLVQASTNAPVVTVTAVDGPVLAKAQKFATATGYAQVPAGVWTIRIDPVAGAHAGGQHADKQATAATTTITARAGSVNTIIVLDGPHGTVTAKTITDASGTTEMPAKHTGVPTGEGGTAPRPSWSTAAESAPVGAASGLALALALTLVGTSVATRRSARRGTVR